MSDKEIEQEPTMEEILSSIRQIISEDGHQENSSGIESGDRLQSFDTDAPGSLEPENESFGEVLELSDEVQDDGTIVNFNTGEKRGNAFSASVKEKAEISDVQASVGTADAQQSSFDVSQTARMLSDMAKNESVSTLAGLASTVDSQRRDSDPSIGSKTIEDLVKEVMRPIIREWLDANLPTLVERLVSREITRLTQEAEDNSER